MKREFLIAEAYVHSQGPDSAGNSERDYGVTITRHSFWRFAADQAFAWISDAVWSVLKLIPRQQLQDRGIEAWHCFRFELAEYEHSHRDVVVSFPVADEIAEKMSPGCTSRQ